MGERDGAEYFIERAAADEAYRCPDCGALPIDWDAVREAVWSVPEDRIWVLAPERPSDPADVFGTVQTAADDLGLDLDVVFEDGGPRCTACGARYDPTPGE